MYTIQIHAKIQENGTSIYADALVLLLIRINFQWKGNSNPDTAMNEREREKNQFCQ